jgi:hypothetical protein
MLDLSLAISHHLLIFGFIRRAFSGKTYAVPSQLP